MIGFHLSLNVIKKNQDKSSDIALIVLIGKDVGKGVDVQGLSRNIHLAKDLIKNRGADVVLRRAKPADDLLLCGDAWLDIFDLLRRDFRTFVVAPDNAPGEK